jgi:hypothetical protein
MEEQYRELERIFGDIEVVVKMIEIKQSQEVKNLIEKVKADETVVVLPNNLVEGLINLGVKPIRAIMDRQMQTDGTAKFSHIKFVRVLDMKIEMEEL